jgi:uncharacterized membrane protein
MVAFIAVPAVILAVAAAARYLNGQSSIDTVIFDQGIWALSRGHAPLSTVIRENLLEDHFGPGILSFALLYRLAATPLWLIIGQVLAASAAVWLIARNLVPALGARRAGLLGAAVLASPPVAYALLFDVHAVVFAAPFALGAILALERGAPRRALVLGLVAALLRIEIGLAVAVAFAVWPGSRKGRLVSGLLLTAYLIVAVHFENALGHDSHWTAHYGYLGTSAGDALAHPWRLVRSLLSPVMLAKPLPWLATGAFLALRRPRLMIPAAVAALPILLSNWPGTGGVVYQYGFAPTLLLALAWAPALREHPERANFVIAASIMLGVLLGPFSPGLPSSNPLQGFLGQYLVPQSESSCIGKGIPAAAVVSGSRPITLIAHRPELYLWPYPFGGVPENMLPGSYLSKGDAQLAARVDYLLVGRSDTTPIPAGFVADGASQQYLRYRRLSTTLADPVDCR